MTFINRASFFITKSFPNNTRRSILLIKSFTLFTISNYRIRKNKEGDEDDE
jgi:hypothetical protein